MPDPQISLRLIPLDASGKPHQGTLKSGGDALVRAEVFKPLGKGPYGLKLVEVDERGLSPEAIAAFKVGLAPQAGGLRFTQAERDGAATAPAEGAPSLSVKFEGQTASHVVAIEKPRTAPEGRYFELGVMILDASGTELYPVGKPLPFMRVDCGPVGDRYARLTCEALNFSNDSAVVPPQGMEVLWGAVDYAKTHMESRLLILSHTDSVGDPASNDALSEDRSLAVLYLLRGAHGGDEAKNREAFVSVCKRRWATKDVQIFLAFADSLGWPGPLEPGGPTSDRGAGRQTLPEKTRRAMLLFSSRVKKGVNATEPTQAEVDALTTVPDAFWGEVYDVYQDYLAQLLGLRRGQDPGQELARIKWLNAETRSLGCGERYPVEKESGKGSYANRRTELVFFSVNGGQPTLDKTKLGPLYDKSVWQMDAVPCPEKPKPPEVELVLPKTKDVLFVIDVSGSMQATEGAEPLEENWRLSRVKRALVELLAEHATTYPDGLINVIAFGGDEKEANNPDPAKRPILLWKDRLTKNDATAQAWVEERRPFGSTPTGLALEHAFRKTVGADGKSQPAELTIVFLSDGMPNGKAGKTVQQVADDLLVQVRGMRTGGRAKWTIDTYGFRNSDGGPALETFMRSLATQNGGTFHPL